MKQTLQTRLRDVQISKRLVCSPVALAILCIRELALLALLRRAA